MKNLIYDLKHSIWEELRDNFLLCIDIGKFNDDLFYGEDIPRVFYDNKVETNDEVREESFRWGRARIIGLVVGGWNLLNHYFLKNKK